MLTGNEIGPQSPGNPSQELPFFHLIGFLFCFLAGVCVSAGWQKSWERGGGGLGEGSDGQGWRKHKQGRHQAGGTGVSIKQVARGCVAIKQVARVC